jgi:chromosome segregation ATPase
MSMIGRLMPIKTADNWCDVCGWRHTTGNCGRDDCPRDEAQPVTSTPPSEQPSDSEIIRELRATLAQVTAERDEARELLGLAAMRINCAGPVHERIDVLRGQLTEQLEAAQRERDAANQSREMISQHWHAIAAEIRIPSQGIDETVTERARRMRQRMEGAEEKVRALEAALREILGMIAALSIRSGVVCAIEQIASEAVSPDTGKETQP